MNKSIRAQWCLIISRTTTDSSYRRRRRQTYGMIGQCQGTGGQSPAVHCRGWILRPVLVAFMRDQLVPGLILLPVLQFPLVSIIPPMFHMSFHSLEYTELFISPSGISELNCATTKTDTAERSISIGRESLQVFFCTRDLGVLPGSTARG